MRSVALYSRSNGTRPQSSADRQVDCAARPYAAALSRPDQCRSTHCGARRRCTRCAIRVALDAAALADQHRLDALVRRGLASAGRSAAVRRAAAGCLDARLRRDPLSPRHDAFAAARGLAVHANLRAAAAAAAARRPAAPTAESHDTA